MNKLLVILFIFGVAGCNNKAIYEKIRLDERNKCDKEPQATYLKCLERTNKSYDEYQREQKENAKDSSQLN